MVNRFVTFAAFVTASIIFLTGLSIPLGRTPALGGLLSPVGGLYDVALEADYPASIEVVNSGLRDKVIVYRDSFGVPHVFGKDTKDVYFVLGYLHAKDRLWQMDIQRRLASGRLSEVLGEATLQKDVFMRKIGLARSAEKTLQAYRDRGLTYVLELFDAEARGVNRYIQDLGNRLPFEFKLLGYKPEHWTVKDMLLWNKFMAWTLTGSVRDLELKLLWDKLGADAIKEMFPIHTPFQIPVIPAGSMELSGAKRIYGEEVNDITQDISMAIDDVLAGAKDPVETYGFSEGHASNNWVIDGAKSVTGKPVLANDPHLQIQLPSIWYEAHLISQDLDVYGVTFPGLPVVVIGHNRYIAWGFTNVGADVIDYFVERVNPQNQLQYWYQGQWRDFVLNDEVIRVKGGAEVKLTIPETIHGPVLTQKGATVSMRWVGSDPSFEGAALFKLNMARNYDEFVDGLKFFYVPAQNVVYADVQGNIAMWVAGKFPIRNAGLGMIPHDGSNGRFEWTSYIPFENLPHALNPKQHYLVSANQKSADLSYPYYLTNMYDPGYRARRANSVLNTTGKFSLADMQGLQGDGFDFAASRFLPIFIKTVDGLGLGEPALKAAVEEVRRWNYVMDKDRAAPLIWRIWLEKFYHGAFDDEWGDLKDGVLPPLEVLEAMVLNQPNSRWFDNTTTSDRVESRDDVIASSLKAAVEQIGKEQGQDPSQWKWGKLHIMVINHLTNIGALNYPRTPRNGDELTLDAAGGFQVQSGPSWRMVVDLSDLGASVGVYPGGQSGNPASRHYSDLTPLWLNYRYHQLLFPASAGEMLTGTVESRLTFKPS